MQTPPDGLREDDLSAVLAREWGLCAASLAYQPVGFGSHHWAAVDAAGNRWFVTADDLHDKLVVSGEPLDQAFGRLGAALATAVQLRQSGAAFVVAPVPTRNGEPLTRAGDQFGVAVYPFVDGQTFTWGELASPEHQRAVLRLLVAVHTAPAAASARAMTDQYVIPGRDHLESALSGTDLPECGPYSGSTSALIAAYAQRLGGALGRYDELASASRAKPFRAVLTHGEPHPGNTMRTADGWRLIDWDTVLLAPPERDLWFLDGPDGALLEEYAQATGVLPDPAWIELYRLRWDLTDIASYVSRFGRPHSGSLDDDKSWNGLRATVERACASRESRTIK